jgi:hypothetical protein
MVSSSSPAEGVWLLLDWGFTIERLVSRSISSACAGRLPDRDRYPQDDEKVNIPLAAFQHSATRSPRDDDDHQIAFFALHDAE